MSDLQRTESSSPDSPKSAPPAEILEGRVVGESNKEGMALVATQSSFFSGPLPPPEILVQYNQATPDAADRIIRMAEKQAAHRQELEMLVTKSNIDRSKQGLVAGSLISSLCLLTSGFCAYIGQSTVAGILGGTTVVSLAGVFVIGKMAQNKELANKNSQNPEAKVPPKDNPAKSLPSGKSSTEDKRRPKPRR